jgi:hypothetical protein
MKKTITIFSIVLFCFPIVAATGATWSEDYSTLSLFYSLDSWKEKIQGVDSKLGEQVFGLRLRHWVNPHAVVDLWSGATALGLTVGSADKQTLSGVNNTRVKATAYFFDRVFSASAMVNLPTGKTKLTSEEYMLAVGITDVARRYAVRRLGQGFDYGAEFFLYPKLENVTVQLGGGFVINGSYQVLKSNDIKYKYGQQVYFAGAADYQTNVVGFAGGLRVATYGSDKYGSQEVYRAGTTILLNARVYDAQMQKWAAGFELLNRGKAKISEGAGPLVEEADKSGQNEFWIYGNGSLPVNDQLRILGRLERKSVGKNSYPTDSPYYRPNASYYGIGGGFSYQVSLSLSLTAMGTYYSGKVHAIEADHDLTGVDAVVLLTYRYW